MTTTTEILSSTISPVPKEDRLATLHEPIAWKRDVGRRLAELKLGTAFGATLGLGVLLMAACFDRVVPQSIVTIKTAAEMVGAGTVFGTLMALTGLVRDRPQAQVAEALEIPAPRYGLECVGQIAVTSEHAAEAAPQRFSLPKLTLPMPTLNPALFRPYPAAI